MQLERTSKLENKINGMFYARRERREGLKSDGEGDDGDID